MNGTVKADDDVKKKVSLNEDALSVDTLIDDLSENLSLNSDGIVNIIKSLKCSENGVERLEMLTLIRRSLPNGKTNNESQDSNRSCLQLYSDIQTVLDSSILPLLYRFLLDTSNPRLQTETMYVIHRLSFGNKNQLDFLVRNGLMGHLILALPSNDASFIIPPVHASEFRVALLAALRNFLIESSEARLSFLTTRGSIERLISIASMTYDLVGFKAVHATIIGEPTFSALHSLSPIVSYFSQLLERASEASIIIGACHGCMCICDRVSDFQVLVDSTCIQSLVLLLLHPLDTVTFEALTVLARLAFSGSTSQINTLISKNIVPALASLLERYCPSVPGNIKYVSVSTKARACNCLGNIGCESPTQVQTLINSDVIPILIHLFKHEPDYNTRIEAAYAVCATVSRANINQVAFIISCRDSRGGTWESNCMQLIADMLGLVKESDPSSSGSIKLCNAILRGLSNILYMGLSEAKREGLCENPYTVMFLECEGEAKLREMQFYPDYTIGTRCKAIIERYFSF